MEDTQILAPDALGVQRAVALLREGQLVAFPTETVYGLGGDAPKTLQAIGNEYKLTRERIRQIQNAALKKIRKKLEQGESPK